MNTHLYAVIRLAKKMGLDRVYIHAFMDGRDTSPTSGIEYIRQLTEVCAQEIGRIATISGRYWAMDRDNRWERVEKAYKALVMEKAFRRLIRFRQCRTHMTRV